MMNRRTFLRLYLIVGAAVAIAPLIKPLADYVAYFYNELGIMSKQYLVVNNTDGLAGFPKYKIANIKDIQQQLSSGCPVYFFAYPLTNEPCFLVDLQVLLGQPVPEIPNPYYGQYAGPLGQMKTISGVGPNNSIYAFSDVCVHLGCQLPAQVLVTSENNPGLDTQNSVLHCPCHGSLYLLAKGGVVIGGPAPRPLPIILLEYDQSSGDIYAVGTNAPYFSASIPRTTPSDNLLYDPRYDYSVPSNPSCSKGG
ncbi:Rieske 2Fe-2S domain-containing protein [Saccharolobus islandicus]|uniref:Rieske (2Fe-2S) domain protein n=1 Tax=Saccharolobus islandicus (strain REY15A) TaxID=930945 RepID=F0ND24_SACI5|nr:Rieske 2Fe-2S domain-containing protein [Sulfolobus islandicus]ADX86321.1 Rieske (2Fe-2S) domain protein [Sulfolobus islandicus REY15A]